MADRRDPHKDSYGPDVHKSFLEARGDIPSGHGHGHGDHEDEDYGNGYGHEHNGHGFDHGHGHDHGGHGGHGGHGHDHGGYDYHGHGGHSHDAHGPGADPWAERSRTGEGEDEEAMEITHFQNVVRAYQNYKNHSVRRLERTQHSYATIPAEQRAKIPDINPTLERHRHAVDVNYAFIQRILEPQLLFEDRPELNTEVDGEFGHVAEVDASKVQSTLRQFARDWSEEGAAERAECYQPMVDEIVQHFGSPYREDHRITVLVPGAGLGRLAFDLARLGYAAQGNEFSYFMLLASNFILNHSKNVNEFEIYPYIHQLANVYNRDDQVRPIRCPDVRPSDLPGDAMFSMSAGDFLDIYEKDVGQWDCVATCFFIDTAKNILGYVEMISSVIPIGGLWVNYGPLLYHFTDMEEHMSIELSWDELRPVILSFGFEITKEERRQTTYALNQRSMMRVTYDCVFFTAVKRSNPAVADE